VQSLDGGLVPGTVKWMYFYRRFLYQGGSHYFFFEVGAARSLVGRRAQIRLAALVNAHV
jgi:hypothetical protein